VPPGARHGQRLCHRLRLADDLEGEVEPAGGDSLHLFHRITRSGKHAVGRAEFPREIELRGADVHSDDLCRTRHASGLNGI
jgi:hypothetical protein